MLCQCFAFREGQPHVLVAIARGIRFQRINSAGLKFSLANLAGIAAISSPNSTENDLPRSVNIETTIVDIVAQSCNLDPKEISFEVDFNSFGIDSLGCLELYHGLTRAFPNIHLHLEDISKCTNFQTIVELISSRSITGAPPFLTYTPTSFSASKSADSAKQIKEIFAQVLNMGEDSIGEDMELSSLGVDSLSCLEVAHLLATRCGVHLSPNFLHSTTTLRDIRNHLSSSGVSRDCGFNSLTDASRIVTENLSDALDHQKQLWCLRKVVTDRTPLILIHDGSGLVASYRHVSNLHRNLYGINSPHFSSSQVGSSITELAATYAGYLQKEIDGPVLVGGEVVHRILSYLSCS